AREESRLRGGGDLRRRGGGSTRHPGKVESLRPGMTSGVSTLGKRTARRAWLPEWCRLLYLDYRRYRVAGRGLPETLLLTQGLWASAVYRICHALVESMPSGPLHWT